jgi:hypothetical protein
MYHLVPFGTIAQASIKDGYQKVIVQFMLATRLFFLISSLTDPREAIGFSALPWVAHKKIIHPMLPVAWESSNTTVKQSILIPLARRRCYQSLASPWLHLTSFALLPLPLRSQNQE